MAALLIYILLSVISVWFILGRRRKTSTADVPYVKFNGDNSPARYQNEMKDLLAKGYEKVLIMFMHPSICPSSN